MEEIAQQFRKELQALLDRYKNRLTTPQIMCIAQSVFTKTIGIRDNPERFKNYKEINGLKVPAEMLEEPDTYFKRTLEGDFKWVD